MKMEESILRLRGSQWMGNDLPFSSIGAIRTSDFSGRKKETASFRHSLEGLSEDARSRFMMRSHGERMSFRRMDESETQSETQRQDKMYEALVFAVLMALTAVAMGILCATKQTPKCGSDYRCWELVEKLEKQVKILNDEILVCESQNSQETQDWNQTQETLRI
jgi:hypothetical protein